MPHVIIGDEAFPLKTYLMRLYPKPQLQVERKQIFNDRLSRARKVVENIFGILAQKFSLYNRRIQLSPENADKVILTTCILQNFIKSSHAHSTLETDITSTRSVRNLGRQGGNSQVDALLSGSSFQCSLIHRQEQYSMVALIISQMQV